MVSSLGERCRAVEQRRRKCVTYVKRRRQADGWTQTGRAERTSRVTRKKSDKRPRREGKRRRVKRKSKVRTEEEEHIRKQTHRLPTN
ncbi:hypothetical protein NDU88_007088 [Pleurodeles waltl]|uniref:Uncharacterized protein n=1 Tax=Pleurodeles waltl TaxID=8319 RepID=A0AAV7MFW9_PLEWA|nr:hypothetical protein NDU88_007088 [Pleurodeles waltl]